MLPLRQFTRSFSRLRKTPEFKLVKFDQNSKGDYELFRNLIIENIEFSALQFLIPNLKHEVDLKDQEQVKEYFEDLEKDAYLYDAYKYVTKNHYKGVLGYKKILRGESFVGNTGWIMHDVDLDGKIHKIERGIHLKQDLCSTNLDLDIPSSSMKKPRYGATIMKEVVLDLERNVNHLNLDGDLVSSILETNTRSQRFTLKTLLNQGQPVLKENNAFKWQEKIGNFVDRIPKILEKLDQCIEESKGR